MRRTWCLLHLAAGIINPALCLSIAQPASINACGGLDVQERSRIAGLALKDDCLHSTLLIYFPFLHTCSPQQGRLAPFLLAPPGVSHLLPKHFAPYASFSFSFLCAIKAFQRRATLISTFWRICRAFFASTYKKVCFCFNFDMTDSYNTFNTQSSFFFVYKNKKLIKIICFGSLNLQELITSKLNWLLVG